MSSIEAALADTSKLSNYRGRQVLAVSAKLTNAGDGLSQSQAVAPVELEIGEEVYVLYKAVVAKHNHIPIDKDNLRGPLKLDLVLKAGTAKIVDASFAEATISDQEALIREAQDRARNVVALPGVAEAEKAARAKKTTKKQAATTTSEPVDDDGFHDPALAAPPPAETKKKA
jgi:hypothetical protein